MSRDVKRETMKCVSHEHASQLLHNKFVLVIGDSIQRGVYKDIVLLLQKDRYLSLTQLRTKGEMSFELDCLVEGGCLDGMHNGTGYREVRQFQSDHHLVRFYFVTRIYSRYMQSVLNDLRQGLKPDVVIINSCVWDISRYSPRWVEDYKANLRTFFEELNGILPQDTLVVWNLTMPLGQKIIGGFLVPEIEHKAPQLRFDVVEANFYSGTLASGYGMDVLDLHFQFRFSLQHRMRDGVHWNAVVHRQITTILLQHTAQAWGVLMPGPPNTVEHIDLSKQQQAGSYARNAAPVRCPAQNQKSPFGILPGLRIQQIDWTSSNRRVCITSPPMRGDGRGLLSSGPARTQEPYSSHGRHYNTNNKEFTGDSLPQSYLSFEENVRPNRRRQNREVRPAHRPGRLPQTHGPVHWHHPGHGPVWDGVDYRPPPPPPHFFHPHAAPFPAPVSVGHHPYIMRNRHPKMHYAPYTHQRPSRHSNHGHYYY
ncbi:PC-esterase domain-containing protein 1A [Polymixia lowei]